MLEVFKMVERVANTDSTILILGESGTGKEVDCSRPSFSIADASSRRSCRLTVVRFREFA